jgi:hypothetical protein
MSPYYSEQAKIEMEKYFIDLAVRLIEKGYFKNWDAGTGETGMRMSLSVENIAEIYNKLRTLVATQTFSF